MLRQSFQGFLNFFLKPPCPLCSRPAESTFCQGCERQLWRCRLGGDPFEVKDVPVFVWGQYRDILKRAIATLKYNSQPQLATPFGYWMADGWQQSHLFSNQKLVVIPIPLHAAKLKKRGFNQAELLGRSFCQMTGFSLQPHGLERVRETDALHRLSKQERQDTLKDVFRLGQGFQRSRPACPVLILDDIYTTGATAQAAIDVLHQHHISVAGIVALATTVKLQKTID